MSRSPEHRDTDVDREHDADTYQVVYFVRRPNYEFDFSIPTAQSAYGSGEEARFQARFLGRQQGQVVVLHRGALEDFYESLSQLMEYVRTEQQHRPRQNDLGAKPDDPPRGG
jgi:hypothetical protein